SGSTRRSRGSSTAPPVTNEDGQGVALLADDPQHAPGVLGVLGEQLHEPAARRVGDPEPARDLLEECGGGLRVRRRLQPVREPIPMRRVVERRRMADRLIHRLRDLERLKLKVAEAGELGERRLTHESASSLVASHTPSRSTLVPRHGASSVSTSRARVSPSLRMSAWASRPASSDRFGTPAAYASLTTARRCCQSSRATSTGSPSIAHTTRPGTATGAMYATCFFPPSATDTLQPSSIHWAIRGLSS